MEKKEATKVTGCRKCNKGQENLQMFLVISGGLLFSLAIYGAVRLIQDIISWF
jgi:hypothetical protein